MAHTTAEYVGQATHNASLASYLRANKTDCLDWAVTCLFYSAVHWVNAYLAKKAIAIPRRHQGSDPQKPGRLNIVQQDSSLRKIYSSYRHLDDESRDARYELRMPSENEYDTFLVRKLEDIANYIRPKVTT